MKAKPVIITLLLAFTLAFLLSAAAVHKQAAAEQWPSGCSCWYYCAGNPPLNPKDPPGAPNTRGHIPFLDTLCVEDLNCQECQPLP